MGLSLRFKPNFLGLLQFLNSINWFIVFFSLINLSECIYEDQIGKFDWRQTYVGRIKFSQFDTVSTAKKIIVATEENVLAALNLKTGQVVWRHVLESASSGNIQLLHVSEKVVTVTGSNPYLVRGWDTSTGVLLWEWSLSLQDESTADFSEWWVQQGMLVHMLPVFGSHIEVTMYNLVTGQNRGASSKLPAAWTNDGCVLSAPYYTCVSGGIENQLLLSMDVTSNAIQILSKPLSTFINFTGYGGNLRSLDGNSVVPGFIVDDKKIILLKENEFVQLNIEVADSTASVTVVDSSSGQLVLQTWSDDVKGFSLIAHNVGSGTEVDDIRCSDPKLQILEPEISAVMCTKTAREQRVCRLLVTGADDAVHLMQQGGRVLWTREEALASVAAEEFVDLPVSALDAAIESEFDQKEGSIWLSFTRRIHTQLQQLRALLDSVVGAGGAGGGSGAGGVGGAGGSGGEPRASLHRDYFNLHKIIVLVTHAGKIFGMDNLSGAILWQRFEPTLEAAGAALFLRRSARHPPHDACLTVVGRHAETGNGLIISVNPIRGTLVGEGVVRLDARLLQAAQLPRADNDKLHALLLLDENEAVQVLPASSSALVGNTHMYVAEPRTAAVRGYALRYDGREVVAHRTWSLQLGGGGGGARLVAWSSKPANERVHSAGRVLGDRSVLYKYTNPNLLLFVTEAPDPLHNSVVSAWCVDGASGAVVAAQAHRRARALPLAVMADHFLAYLYYNDKLRRTEIATLELYEGKQRWVPAGGAFSSWAVAGAGAGAGAGPAVRRQAYIVPGAPRAAAVTDTERGITDKHVLLAMSTGAIVELPWAYLEPRRPVSPTAAHREEGLLPYAPELPLLPEAVLNYNRTVARVRRVRTAPSGLESTALVLATGLDIFYTRVAPSKTFDLLKDDFDHYLIVVVLAALTLASYGTRHFASRKALRMAWK